MSLTSVSPKSHPTVTSLTHHTPLGGGTETREVRRTWLVTFLLRSYLAPCRHESLR